MLLQVGLLCILSYFSLWFLFLILIYPFINMCLISKKKYFQTLVDDYQPTIKDIRRRKLKKLS